LDNLSIVILTFNEELNIEKCLNEAKKIAEKYDWKNVAFQFKDVFERKMKEK